MHPCLCVDKFISFIIIAENGESKEEDTDRNGKKAAEDDNGDKYGSIDRMGKIGYDDEPKIRNPDLNINFVSTHNKHPTLKPIESLSLQNNLVPKNVQNSVNSETKNATVLLGGGLLPVKTQVSNKVSIFNKSFSRFLSKFFNSDYEWILDHICKYFPI